MFKTDRLSHYQTQSCSSSISGDGTVRHLCFVSHHHPTSDPSAAPQTPLTSVRTPDSRLSRPEPAHLRQCDRCPRTCHRCSSLAQASRDLPSLQEGARPARSPPRPSCKPVSLPGPAPLATCPHLSPCGWWPFSRSESFLQTDLRVAAAALQPPRGPSHLRGPLSSGASVPSPCVHACVTAHLAFHHILNQEQRLAREKP